MSGSDRIWPGRSKREPSPTETGWSIRKPIADWLRREGAAAAGRKVLDVVCGSKPYQPFFADAHVTAVRA